MISFSRILVINHNGEIVRAATSTIQLRSGRFDWHGYIGDRGTLEVADEGVTWIRGDHHREDSPEVESLKAASMLAREEAPRTQPTVSFHSLDAELELARPQQQPPRAPPRFRPVPTRNVSSFRRR